MSEYKIFDFHTHIFPDNVEEKAVAFLRDFYKIDISNKARLVDLIASAQEADVIGAVIHATATNPQQVENINSWISSIIMQQHEIKLIGFGTLHQDYPDFVKELNRIRELGLKGIKLHPDFQKFNIDDEKMYPIYEAIGDTFPVLFHIGDEVYDYSSPIRLRRVIDEFPKLRVICAHLGGYARWDEARKYLVGRDIFLDTSSALWRLPPAEAIKLIRKHGTDRILFGTDFPITSHTEELERFFRLNLKKSENEAILYENVAKLLDIDP